MRISCIMPTMASRSGWLERAIDSYRAQDWPNKELIVVVDSDQIVSDGRGTGIDVPAYIADDSTIRFIEAARGQTTGVKRNAACAIATGSVIAHFDDDDYSAPGRLSDQYWRLKTSGMEVTGYHSMYFTDGARWWSYDGHLQDTLGTSLMYWRSYWQENRFPDLRLGEDGIFIQRAIRQAVLRSVPADKFMYATVHAGNTSPRQIPSNPPPGCSWRSVENPFQEAA